MMLISESDAVRIGKAVAAELYKLSPELAGMFGPHSWNWTVQLIATNGPPPIVRFYWNGSELRMTFVGYQGELLDEIYFTVRGDSK